MRRLSIVILAAAMLLVAAPSTLAQEPSTSDAIRIYTKYNNLRDRLVACKLDKIWDNLSTEQRRDCRALRRYYVLYTAYAESSDYQVHCIYRRHCLATPDLDPPASGPIPASAHVYRY
jgi:hypothetical protein